MAAVDSDDMQRRAFVQLLALWGGSAAGLGSIDFERYAAVLAGIRADAPALDEFERVTLAIYRQRPIVSPTVLIPAVRGHLAGLRDLIVMTPPALAPRAYSLAGQTALLAGVLWGGQEDRAQADVYYSLAERWAESAGDARLRAAIFEHRGGLWSTQYSTDHLPLALTALDRAVALLGSSPEPVAAAYILSFRAGHYAKASHAQPDYAVLAMRDLDQVQTHLSRMPSADATVYTVDSVTGEAAHEHARALVYLNRPADAVTHLERLLASIDDRDLSWRAAITADLAAAHAVMGEVEHSAVLLAEALQLATRASSARKLNRVRQARQRWLTEHDGPALRRLDDQLRALPSPLVSPGLPPAPSA
jgi:hypothetical protein